MSLNWCKGATPCYFGKRLCNRDEDTPPRARNEHYFIEIPDCSQHSSYLMNPTRVILERAPCDEIRRYVSALITVLSIPSDFGATLPRVLKV